MGRASGMHGSAGSRRRRAAGGRSFVVEPFWPRGHILAVAAPEGLVSSLRTSNGYNAKCRKVYEPVEAALPAPSTHNEEWRRNRSKVFGAFGGFWLTGALRAYISHGGRKSNQEQQRLRPCLFE